jgi:hypothetical protein
MQKLATVLAGCLAMSLPSVAQKAATPSGEAQLKTVAWQDQDDRKPQGDQDDQNRRDRDKKDRDRKDRDTKDRDDRNRARGDQDDHNRGDRDRDRTNTQSQDRDRDQQGGYYGNGQYGDRDRDRQGGYGNGQYGRGGQYHNVLAPEWQQKFDSYYQRWQQYRATNNQSEMNSMEKRMQDIMVHYNIPTNVPYDQVASPGVGGYQNRY